jgi:SAM-dependent methyltransferase
MNNLELHVTHLKGFMQATKTSTLYESWWDDSTVNYWRHTRLLSPVLEVLYDLKDFSWLTIGDGAGTDSWRLQKAGFKNVTASDLSDSLLIESNKRGYINNYSVINAEKIDLPDDYFDFILCKETLHHMSNPYQAIHECLRVAKFGVVLIEPQDPWIDPPVESNKDMPSYEEVGNYVYTFSKREIEKIAYGLNLRGVATKGQTDAYIPGCEFAHCIPGDEIWEETQKAIELHQNYISQKLSKGSYIQAILFNQRITVDIFETLSRIFTEWHFQRTDTNPYL